MAGFTLLLSVVILATSQDKERYPPPPHLVLEMSKSSNRCLFSAVFPAVCCLLFHFKRHCIISFLFFPDTNKHKLRRLSKVIGLELFLEVGAFLDCVANLFCVYSRPFKESKENLIYIFCYPEVNTPVESTPEILCVLANMNNPIKSLMH